VVLNVTPDDARWVAENMPDQLRGGPMHSTYTLLFNTTRKPFDDVRVRKALSLAIDRDAIANRLLRTGVRPAWNWVSPGIGGYPGIPSADEKLTAKARQDRARALLKEAGFGPGNPLVVPVTYDTNEENRKILVGIAAMWQAVGVKAELVNVEFRALMGQLRARNFSVARSSTFPLYDDPYAFLQQLSGRSPGNWTGWNNPRYDQLIQQGNAAADPAERHRLLAEAEALVAAEQPLVPIYYYHGKLLLSPRVKGWWDAAIGTPPSRWLSVTE
jgi:oligopeptide transport system substrate-binding protein